MSNWKPIDDSTPKDRRILLGWTKNWMRHCIVGEWRDDRYSKNPRPYWTHDQVYTWGVRACRNQQPDVWMELPRLPS